MSISDDLAGFRSCLDHSRNFPFDHGADPNRVDIAYYKAPDVYLEDAVRCASLEIIKLLLKHGAQIEQSGAIQQAAQIGRLDIMEFLVKHGADVNEQLKENDPMQSSKRRTRLRKLRNEAPLHFSVFSYQPEATRWLIDHGADADVVDSQGWSPRGIAIQWAIRTYWRPWETPYLGTVTRCKVE
jgi:ankyrin repeat protein